MVRLHDLQSQMPTEWRLTLVLPQKVQTYLACWVISIFFTDFRREAPYLYTILSVSRVVVKPSTIISSHSHCSQPVVVRVAASSRRESVWPTLL